jgi:hypothetical protein
MRLISMLFGNRLLLIWIKPPNVGVSRAARVWEDPVANPNACEQDRPVFRARSAGRLDAVLGACVIWKTPLGLGVTCAIGNTHAGLEQSHLCWWHDLKRVLPFTLRRCLSAPLANQLIPASALSQHWNYCFRWRGLGGLGRCRLGQRISIISPL